MSSVTHFIRELTLFGPLGSAKGATRVTVGFSGLSDSEILSDLFTILLEKDGTLPYQHIHYSLSIRLAKLYLPMKYEELT